MRMDFQQDADQFLSFLTIQRGLSDNTVAAYGEDIRRFIEFLKAKEVPDWGAVDTDTILDFLESERDSGHETATLARRLVSIKVLFRHLTEAGKIPRNPAAVMDSPKLWRILPDFLSESEVDAFLDAYPASVAENPLDLRNRAMLELLYASGLRVSESAMIATFPITRISAGSSRSFRRNCRT